MYLGSLGESISPKDPKSRIQSGYFNHVSRTCAYSSHQVSSRCLHSKRFPIFPVFPSNSPQYHRTRSGLKTRALRCKVLLNIKFHQDSITEVLLNIKFPQDSRTEIAKAQKIPLPKLPQRDRIQSGYFNHVSRTCAYSFHQVSSRCLHSKRFPIFPVFPPILPNIIGPGRDLKQELRDARSF